MAYTLFQTHGYHFVRGEGVRAGLYPVLIFVEEARIILHEADLPELVVDLADAHELTGEDDAEVIFRWARQVRPKRVTRLVRS